MPEQELGGECTVYLVDPDGVAPQIFLQEVPEPKVVKNRLHLDLRVGGGLEVPVALRRQRVQAEVDRLIGEVEAPACPGSPQSNKAFPGISRYRS